MQPYLSYARNRAGIEMQRLRLSLAPSPDALDTSALVESLPQNPNVLFLCYGNICRSPLGERYLRSAAAEREIEGLSVDSAGLRTSEGRSSPDDAIEVAAEFGVDLSDHRSKPVTDEHLQWSDVVFVMDLLNYHHLRQGFGDQGGKTVFLGAFSEDGSYEINDPYGETLDQYRTLYGGVVNGVDEFLERSDLE